MKAIGSYVLVEKIEESVEQAGILMSATDKENLRYKKGKVVAVGDEVHGLDVDDVIYFDGNAGHTLLINDIKTTVILKRDIVVVV